MRPGCQCLPTWSYQSSKGVTYTITNGTCQNPGGEWNTFWCYVDPVRHMRLCLHCAVFTCSGDGLIAGGRNPCPSTTLQLP